MNLFNILCVYEPENGLVELLYTIILPVIGLIPLIYGIASIINNFGKKSDVSKKKLKRGVFAFILSVIVLGIAILLMSNNIDSLKDPCDNVSPMYSLLKNSLGMFKALIPFAFLVLAVFNIIKMIMAKDKVEKKELLKKAITYFIISVVIFLVFVLISVIIGILGKSNEPVNLAMCWCK